MPASGGEVGRTRAERAEASTTTIITTINRIAIITINRIASITTMNRIAMRCRLTACQKETTYSFPYRLPALPYVGERNAYLITLPYAVNVIGFLRARLAIDCSIHTVQHVMQA